MDQRIYIAALVLLTILIVALAVWKKRAGGCSPTKPCTDPAKRCVSGKCVAPPAPSVYVVNRPLNYSEAKALAETLGATIATYDQLAAAQKAGAQWCLSAWTETSYGQETMYPMQVAHAGCGGQAGVNTGDSKPAPDSKQAVNLYGVRPSKLDGLLPFYNAV